MRTVTESITHSLLHTLLFSSSRDWTREGLSVATATALGPAVGFGLERRLVTNYHLVLGTYVVHWTHSRRLSAHITNGGAEVIVW